MKMHISQLNGTESGARLPQSRIMISMGDVMRSAEELAADSRTVVEVAGRCRAEFDSASATFAQMVELLENRRKIEATAPLPSTGRALSLDERLRLARACLEA